MAAAASTAAAAARLLQRQLGCVLAGARCSAECRDVQQARRLWTQGLIGVAQHCQHNSNQLSRPQQQQHALHWQLLVPFQGFAAHYAKGKAGKKGGGKGRAAADDEDEDAAAAAAAEQEPDFDPQSVERLMQAAVEHLQHELAGVRTGRANPGLLENLMVEAHGDKLPMKACGSVTVRNPQLLAVVLFDASLAKSVEKAIRDSPLSLNAQTEGGEVLVKLPRMTKDTIEKMVKLVNLEAEGAHQSIRRARTKGMDAIKKAFKAASEDDKKRAEKEVQKLHDVFVAEVERLKRIKDTELREHKD